MTSSSFAGTDGHGASTITDENGVVLPADIYFKRRNYELPPYYEKGNDGKPRRLSVKDLPNVAPHLEKMVNILKVRAYTAHLPLPDFNKVEIYFTSKLSGSDPLEVEAGRLATQVTYTYWFSQYDPELRENRTRRIIEILKPSNFFSLSPEDQALTLLHEGFHHFVILGHDWISPVIKEFRIVYSVESDRKFVDFNELFKNGKEKEINAYVALQELLSKVIPTALPITAFDNQVYDLTNKKRGYGDMVSGRDDCLATKEASTPFAYCSRVENIGEQSAESYRYEKFCLRKNSNLDWPFLASGIEHENKISSSDKPASQVSIGVKRESVSRDDDNTFFAEGEDNAGVLTKIVINKKARTGQVLFQLKNGVFQNKKEILKFTNLNCEIVN
jgi:hypothetical protein